MDEVPQNVPLLTREKERVKERKKKRFYKKKNPNETLDILVGEATKTKGAKRNSPFYTCGVDRYNLEIETSAAAGTTTAARAPHQTQS